MGIMKDAIRKALNNYKASSRNAEALMVLCDAMIDVGDCISAQWMADHAHKALEEAFISIKPTEVK